MAPKYGECAKPPYQAVRIPLDLANRTAIKDWLAQIDDRSVAERIGKWINDNNKQVLTSLPIPIDHCKMHGVPLELATIIDSQRIVLTLTKSYRNILESLGFYPKRDMMICEQGY